MRHAKSQCCFFKKRLPLAELAAIPDASQALRGSFSKDVAHLQRRMKGMMN